MFKNIQKMTAIYLTVIFFVALDRFLKVFAFANQASEFNLLGEILKFNYKINYYIAFSLPLAGNCLIILIILVIIILILLCLYYIKRSQLDKAMALFLMVAGASSNLFDRLKYGFVIDYIDLKYFTVFNFADIMIVYGVAYLLLIIKNYQYATIFTRSKFNNKR
jgi:signal peptidase II